MKLGILAVAAMFAATVIAPGRSVAADAVVADVAAAPVLEDRYPRAKVAFEGGVASYPDLIYSTPAGFRPLRLDLYRLEAATKPLPLVIYVHGGGWQSGHTRHSGAFANWPKVLASLAARGYAVASLEYRLSDEAPFPAAIHDVKTAIRWLRAKSGEFAIDSKQVVIWGGSAGGQLAALAATSCGEQALLPALSAELASQSDCVQGLVTWYGVFDFKTIPELSSPAVKYLGCKPSQCADIVALASPIARVDARDPPTLLIHGEQDKVVPVTQSRAFHEALQAKGVSCDLMVIPGVDHSFIGASPEATHQASLAALAKTFAFIDTLSRGARQ